MRVSTIVIALASSVAAGSTSSVVPVQQIGDGQIQNPVTAAPPAVGTPSIAVPPVSGPASGPAASASKSGGSSASASGPLPPAITSPGAGSSPPGYGNTTSTVTGVKTITSSLVKPSSPAASGPAGSAPAGSAPAGSAPSATTSKPAVQTGAANSMIGSTYGLGFAALMAAFLG